MSTTGKAANIRPCRGHSSKRSNTKSPQRLNWDGVAMSLELAKSSRRSSDTTQLPPRLRIIQCGVYCAPRVLAAFASCRLTGNAEQSRVRKSSLCPRLANPSIQAPGIPPACQRKAVAIVGKAVLPNQPGFASAKDPSAAGAKPWSVCHRSICGTRVLAARRARSRSTRAPRPAAVRLRPAVRLRQAPRLDL
jgi:hypothetical protein